MFKLDLAKARDQIANIYWIIEKAREFQKNIYFCFTDYVTAFDCVDHNKLWKILQEMGDQTTLPVFVRNVYTSQKATLRIFHGKNEWFKTGKKSMTRLCTVTLLI